MQNDRLAKLKAHYADGAGRGVVERPGAPTVAPGQYFHSEFDLYRVERVEDERALVEDCRSGVLVDIEIGLLLTLERVSR